MVLDNDIVVRNLCKEYTSDDKNIVVLNNLDIQIKKGECCAILGPNGAGKSTFIGILSGIVKKTSGYINVGGFNLDKDIHKIKLKLGVVTQETTSDVFFSSQDTLMFTAGYYGMQNKRERVTHLLNELNLWDKKDVKFRALSGGMKRRLSIAKAVIHDPDIIILDEPTVGIDIQLREQIYTYIKKLKQEKKTILITTHYLKEAQDLCDSYIFIDKGNLIAYKDKHDLFNQTTQELIINAQKEIVQEDLEQEFKTNEYILSDDKKTLTLFLDSYAGRLNEALFKIQNIFAASDNSIISVNSGCADLEKIYRQMYDEKRYK